MKSKIQMLLFVLCVSTSKGQITASLTIPNPIPEYNGTYEDYGSHHLFYPNESETRYANEEQTNAIEEVKFYTKHTYPHQYLLANNDISFVFVRRDSVGTTPVDSLHRIDLEMDNGNPAAFLARIDTVNTGVLNYFTEWYPSGRTVKGGSAIAVQSIYHKIDMVYTSNNTGLKIYYVVYPGGNPNDIVLKFNGSKTNYISGNNLVVEANWSSMQFVKPKWYQYTYASNVVTPVNVCPASWQSIGSDSYQIQTTSYWNPALPLIIQVSQGAAAPPAPPINTLRWSTYFGGGNMDWIMRTKSDPFNYLYASGQTLSNDFPLGTGPTPVQTTNFNFDGFLSKFNAAGWLQWSTYFGGSSAETIQEFDFKGLDVYCVGNTESSNLPVQTKTGAFNDASYAGGPGGDGFIFQVDRANGAINKWATYFGGNRYESLRGCKFDSNGDFFVVGMSSSTNLAALVTGPGGAYQVNYNSAQQPAPPSSPVPDGMIIKFNSSTDLIDWFTFYGTDAGSSGAGDHIYDIDIDGTDIFVAGATGGNNLPSSTNVRGGTSVEGFLANFSTSGALINSCYTTNFVNRSVRIFNGEVLSCGYGMNGMYTSNSGMYYYDGTCGISDDDASFIVFPLNLSTPIHSTFIGDTFRDEALEMQVTANGVIYIAGFTQGNNFPVTSIVANTYNQGYAGADDYFICALQSGNPNLLWSTCLGSPTNESDGHSESVSITCDGQGFLHIGGSSDSYNAFPLDNNMGLSYFQPARAGTNTQPLVQWDATITRFDLALINTIAGVEDFEGTSFSYGLYPNPTSKSLTVDNTELLNQNLRYAVYNSVGQKINEGNLNSATQRSIDVSTLQQGVYIINVSNGKRTFSNKFIKTND